MIVSVVGLMVSVPLLRLSVIFRLFPGACVVSVMVWSMVVSVCMVCSIVVLSLYSFIFGVVMVSVIAMSVSPMSV